MNAVRVGLDIGSTTVKVIALDKADDVIFERYSRHGSDIKSTLVDLLREAESELGSSTKVKIAMTGSGALAISEKLGLYFIQEVAADALAVRRFIPSTTVAIELGGEDAKVIFFDGNTIDKRMNDACAGGTGAFIDQMAILMGTDADGLNDLARGREATAIIPSRCGVYAKSELQPIINEGYDRGELAASIFLAVVKQTVGNLARGRKIRGRIAFLGGPLYYMDALRQSFRDFLGLKENQVCCPENANTFVALGAALAAGSQSEITLDRLIADIESMTDYGGDLKYLPILFDTDEDRAEFDARHHRATERRGVTALDRLYLGVDAGSTTFKAVLIAEDGVIIDSWYMGNSGDLKGTVAKFFDESQKYHTQIAYTVATGYGENYLMEKGITSKTSGNHLRVDSGEVETVAHYRAALAHAPDVSFILDIGGKDMKALKIENRLISEILLNEACSSGCGSFIETYARSLDLTIEEFTAAALRASSPIDLGTRCTVFMNSSTKQAQKNGAAREDVIAGLCYSVVKNALYKVIRLKCVDDLGPTVVVQGGTFKNDAILRAFELETGLTPIRPDIAELMGAYGAALIARDRAHGAPIATSVTGSGHKDQARLDLVAEKYSLLFDRKSSDFRPKYSLPSRGQIGIPRALNMYDNYPFWHRFLSELGFDVVPSAESSKDIHGLGLDTVPAGIICYPAKLLHGHIVWLLNAGIKRIFMPCIKWERSEDKTADNHFNCPIVAGYSDVMPGNIDQIKESGAEYFRDFLPYDRPRQLRKALARVPFFRDIPRKELKKALEAAYEEDREYRATIRALGRAAIDICRREGRRMIILAGHPYHIDPEIGHEISELFTRFGVAVLTEDSVAHLVPTERPLRVVDQWTYHARLYRAASYVAQCDDTDLVQLVSFACGLDALTSDQNKELLEDRGKKYAMIKIDEMSDRGNARLHIRSFLAAP